MPEWSSWATASASFRNRRMLSSEAWSPARIIFRATERLEVLLPRQVDDSHPAAGQLPDQREAAEAPAGLQAVGVPGRVRRLAVRPAGVDRLVGGGEGGGRRGHPFGGPIHRRGRRRGRGARFPAGPPDGVPAASSRSTVSTKARDSPPASADRIRSASAPGPVRASDAVGDSPGSSVGSFTARISVTTWGFPPAVNVTPGLRGGPAASPEEGRRSIPSGNRTGFAQRSRPSQPRSDHVDELRHRGRRGRRGRRWGRWVTLARLDAVLIRLATASPRWATGSAIAHVATTWAEHRVPAP